MQAVTPAGEDLWQASSRPVADVRFCANAAHDICNWLISTNDDHAYCQACRYNRIVPVTDNPEGLARWQKIGQAQRHLFYSLLRWKLPRPGRDADPQGGLVFDFLADEVDANGNVVPAMTGHEDGLISLRAAEANDATRESVRVSMNEPYRTLLGHFRHEIGHFYWAQLVHDEQTLAEARALFGDEREDYAEALKAQLRTGTAGRLAAELHQHLCQRPPGRRFCRLLGAFLPHCRYAGDSPLLRPVHRAPPPRGHGRRSRFRPLPRERCPTPRRCLGPLKRSTQQHPAQHGSARQLPLRAVTPGGAETRFHQQFDTAGRGGVRAVKSDT